MIKFNYVHIGGWIDQKRTINAGYYFVLFSWSYMRLLLCGVGCFPWLWVSPWFSGTLAFKIRATLHCYKTNNYKFTTMFHLYTKCFLHELAIGILWLDKGDSWIYLTHGVLIDFFCSASFNVHLVKVVSIKIKMNIYAPRKENRKTKLSSAKWKINFGQNWCLSGFLFEVFFFSECLVSNYKVAHISLRSILRCRIIYDCIV